MGISWATLGLSRASLGPLLGSLTPLLGSLGLSWASLQALLNLSWPTLGLLLGSFGALLGLPEGVQKGSQKGTPKKTAPEPILCEFWGPFLVTFLVHFGVPFLVPFFIASWLHLGPQKWPKRLQDDTSKHLKVLKNHVFVSCFLHIASFVALTPLRAFLGPSWCQLGLSRAVFWFQNMTQNGSKIGTLKRTSATQPETGLALKVPWG